MIFVYFEFVLSFILYLIKLSAGQGFKINRIFHGGVKNKYGFLMFKHRNIRSRMHALSCDWCPK